MDQKRDYRYSADTITIGDGDPAVVEQLNDILEGKDLGRPLAAPARTYGTRAVVPVLGANPLEVYKVLRDAGTAVDPWPEQVYYNGTFELQGKDIGHAFSYAELTDIDPQDTPKQPKWKRPPHGLRRPVIALLDSGVQNHPWLPNDPADPFVLHSDDDALDDRWSSPIEEAKDGDPEAGHATFIAGLIRQTNPVAQVLSVRVMNGEGKVNESTVADALRWLEGYHERHPVDVLLMAFGRESGDDENQQTLGELKASLKRLVRAGIAVVASAGNEHQSQGIYPAKFKHVTAVGAGFGEYHATFSNFGDWVDRYREGANVLSIMPPDKWARWSGTSFSAAVFAADLARPRVVGR
jgi:hypothetical protein